MSALNTGDVVRLKSGGPKMTVTQVAVRDGVTVAWTAWFDGTTTKDGHYPVNALEIAPARAASVRLAGY
jgi:uncharacterized protein YodC (DUF2158 family)